jgi:hypothetical protein
MEYDRDGYRYDGAAGLFQSGANPSPKNADYYIFGIQAGNDASSYAGAGFFEVTSNTGIYPPDQVINQATLKVAYDNSSSSYKVVGRKYQTWSSGGVAEADCLMCHLNGQYANLQRNHAFPGAAMPKLAATLGLHGTFVTVGNTPTGNPDPANRTWSGSGDVVIPGNNIAYTPKKENCALCHFPDRSNTTPGPSGRPLGFTVFQATFPPGTVYDSDEIPGVNEKDGLNDVTFNRAKGRTEGGKRGESINDPKNPDAHMDGGMKCAYCHYNLSGNFSALKDKNGNVIQPAITVQTIDHQFAKGDNQPDGKNMDQLDNTVTCESCHITGTHPNASGAPNPAAAHAGIPSIHFNKISCKTCHIPFLNGPYDQDVADFTVGPYQTFERTQVQQAGSTGVGRRPVWLWKVTEHGVGPGSHAEIQPFGIMTTTVVANATSVTGDPAQYECGSITPTYQRVGKKAAENLRAHYDDTNSDGVYDWRLNAPQNGDIALIVNTQTEITDFVTQLRLLGVANPVIHFYFNQFSISHNVMPKAGSWCANCSMDTDNDGQEDPGERKYILGSSAGGGCVMCHSSSDPNSPNYSPKSVGFFDRQHTLFSQPTDGGNGLVQTAIATQSPLPSGTLEAINIKFPIKLPNGASSSINLSMAPGQTVRNYVTQSEVLGYSQDKLAKLMNPLAIAGASGSKPKAKIKVRKTGNARGLEVQITDQSVCPSGSTCTKVLKVDTTNDDTCDPQTVVDISSGTANYTFSLPNGVYVGKFCAQITVTNDLTGLTSSHVVPIRLVKKNEKPTITGDALPDTGTVNTAVSIDSGFTVGDSDDAATALTVRIVWGDGTVDYITPNSDGTVTASHTYTRAKTYKVRITVIDTRGGRSGVIEEITVSPSSP